MTNPALPYRSHAVGRTALACAVLLLGSLVTAAASAETVLIEAGRDNTLIEDSSGARSNGAGPAFFVGRTSQAENGVRRGLLYFDVASALPDDAVIEEVFLTLYATPGNPEPRELRLHRALADWGEGASYSEGGNGAPSELGDATWLHTFFDQEFWVRNGGHSSGRASARAEVHDAGFYTWGSTKKLVRDVEHWRSAPHRNFGWLLFGDETVPQTSKRFASREEQDPALRPVLEVTYSRRGNRR